MHNHSTHSDGLLSPTQLIELAASAGVTGVALTDHDTTDGLPEAEEAARSRGMQFVPGVEISVTWGSHTLHVVGLGIDRESPGLVAGLDAIRAGRLDRGRRIGEMLGRLGFEGTLEAALEHAGDERRLSRTHFARVLHERGAVRDLQAAFDKYLATGKPAYLPHQWAGLAEAVGWILGAGGVAVLAHPGRYNLKPMMRHELLTQFRSLGGEAIEVVTGSHRKEEYALWQRVAEEHGFLASRGADFHGPGESPVEPGRLPPLPASVRPVWTKWAH